MVGPIVSTVGVPHHGKGVQYIDIVVVEACFANFDDVH